MISPELKAVSREFDLAPNGPVKSALAKKAYMLADKEHNLGKSVWFRYKYIEQEDFYGDPLQLILVYPELLKLHDEYVKTVSDSYTFYVYWSYKWLLQNAKGFYQISQKQFDAFAEDYKRRLTESGYSLRTLYLISAGFYSFIDQERAETYYKNFLRCGRDRLSDCAACERSNEMHYLIDTGRFDEAVRLGQEIFDNKLTCIEQPYEASGVLLEEYVNMMLSGDDSVMEKCARHIDNIAKGLKKGVVLSRVSHIILYYALTGETTKALSYFKKYSLAVHKQHSPGVQFELDIACAKLFKTINKKSYRFKLTPEHPVYKESGVYNCEELSSFYLDDAMFIAGKYDARNGTDIHMKRISLVMEG